MPVSGALESELPGLRDAMLRAADAAGVGIAVTLVDGELPRLVHVNDAACRVLGRSREQLLAGPVLLLIAPEDRENVARRIRERAAGLPLAPVFHTTIERPDGARVTLQVATAPLALSERRASVSFFMDATQLRDAQDSARRSEAQLRALVEWLPDAVVITRRGTIVYANQAGAQMLAYESPAEMLGHSLAEHLEASELAVMMERVRAMMERGASHPPREYRAKRRDGTSVIAELRSHLVDWDGERSVLGVARDATERQRLEAQLRRADRLAALGTLAAGVAHEINNPLAFVMLGLEALRRTVAGGIDDETQRERALALLADMEQGAERVAAVVRDLKAFARADEEANGPVDVLAALADAERLAAHETRHRADVRNHVEGRPIVIAGRRRLEQVLVNLLVNAGQAFDEHRPENAIDVHVGERGADVVIEVRDNGPGIEPELVQRVFDPFFTTKPAGEGTGLGLAICHGIVTAMGGAISIESAPGAGTVVTVTLPRASGAPGRPAAEPPPTPAMASLDLLVVDDEPALARTIARFLSAHHRTRYATSGAEALDAIAARQPDVVICDLMMPGMSGAELYDAVCARRPALASRFVFITGGAVTAHATRFLDRDALVCVQKPFTPEELHAAIESVHARPTTR